MVRGSGAEHRSRHSLLNEAFDSNEGGTGIRGEKSTTPPPSIINVLTTNHLIRSINNCPRFRSSVFLKAKSMKSGVASPSTSILIRGLLWKRLLMRIQ